MDDERVVHVGPYELRLPDFWHEQGDVRQKPGFYGYDAIATPGVSFGFYVLVGRGKDAAARENLVATQVRGKAPERHLTEESVFQGVQFERHRLEECAKLAPRAVFDSFLCDAYGDLVQLSYAFVAPHPQEELLQVCFLTMVTGALVSRGYALMGDAPS